MSLSEDPPPTVARVDPERYAGTWHEVARLPVFYQGVDERAMAQYRLKGDGTLEVLNTAISPDGSRRSVSGSASPVPESGNARYRVRIDKFPGSVVPVPDYGNYWILQLDGGYRHALVGTPDRKFLWFLSRERTMPPEVFERYREFAEENGYAVGKLLDFNAPAE